MGKGALMEHERMRFRTMNKKAVIYKINQDYQSRENGLFHRRCSGDELFRPGSGRNHSSVTINEGPYQPRNAKTSRPEQAPILSMKRVEMAPIVDSGKEKKLTRALDF
jgi:hypothetical protein